MGETTIFRSINSRNGSKFSSILIQIWIVSNSPNLIKWESTKIFVLEYLYFWISLKNVTFWSITIEWVFLKLTVISIYSRIDLWFRVDVVQPRLREVQNGFSWSKRHFFLILGHFWSNLAHLRSNRGPTRFQSCPKMTKSGQLRFVTCHNQLRTCSKWIIIMVMWYIRPRMTNWIIHGVKFLGDERECLGINSKMIF